MNKEFVPYEIALALKELGFKEECFGGYTIYTDGDIKLTTHYNSYSQVQAPTFSQAFRFFREKYQLPNWVYTSNNKEFWYSILKDGRMIVRDYTPLNSYEEAELACLNKLIELVKNK